MCPVVTRVDEPHRRAPAPSTTGCRRAPDLVVDSRADREKGGDIVATRSAQPATNERIVRLLEEVKAQLADSKKRQERIAQELARLLKRK
jgi:hypothetical protein